MEEEVEEEEEEEEGEGRIHFNTLQNSSLNTQWDHHVFSTLSMSSDVGSSRQRNYRCRDHQLSYFNSVQIFVK